ncbi:hypothetical protein RRG08_016054 [Elysia crispata]|uniref:Uncharacterized protein n=1 Tax=Elysia crispata TaxID=231223 RepID=A0AAE0ZPG7_9GAST|nr:hypothetical protein RRG08_016054 [Elysia crispata]
MKYGATEPDKKYPRRQDWFTNEEASNALKFLRLLSFHLKKLSTSFLYVASAKMKTTLTCCRRVAVECASKAVYVYTTTQRASIVRAARHKQPH